jgi:hypothetical protein
VLHGRHSRRSGGRWLWLWLALALGPQTTGGASADASGTSLRGWQPQVVGGAAGAVADSPGSLTLTARRSHLRDGGDAFQCFCTTLEGDGELTAHLVALGTSTPRLAVMMRERAATEAPFVATLADAQGAWQASRAASGGPLVPSPATPPAATPTALPVWMRLVRRGQTFTSSVSADGRSWSELGRATVPMGAKVLAGLALLHDGDGETRAGVGGISLRQPFRGQALTVPGRIEAEDFDRGGEGVGYHDTTPGDAGQLRWREEDVDIKAVDGGGYRITETAASEWLEYSLSVDETQDYRIDVRVASSGCGGTFHLELDGRDITGVLPFPNTDSFSREWTLVGPQRVSLPRGDSRLRLVIDTVGPSERTAAGSIDWISIVRSAPRASTHAEPPSARRAAAATEVHPRLFLTRERLEALKRAVAVRDSLHAHVFGEIKRRVEAEDWRAYDETPGPEGLNYGRMGLAQEAALLYLLTGEQRYSQAAYRALESVYSEPDPNGAFLEPDDYRTGVLHRSHLGLGFALAYDWSAPGWSAEQRTFVRGKIVNALDRWPCVGNPALESPYESHWVAAFRGAELVLMLAAGEEQARPERYAQLKEVLNQHMQRAYGPSGLFHRGLGFGVEAAQFLMPAVYASRSVGDRDLDPEFSAHSWWRLLMATTPLGEAPLLLQAGFIPSLPASARVSWASLLLGSVEPKDLPYFLWFYDRLVGHQAAGTRFGGTSAVWALLYYPDQMKPGDPNQVLDARLEDPVVGANFFRSRWRDAGDVLVSVLADSKATSNFARWNVADAFGLNLIAHGQWLIQNAATEPMPQSFSSLLVDGAAFDESTRTGAVEGFEPRGRGGSLVLDGGTKYAKLGLERAKRHVSVDFPTREASCVLATLDRVRAAASHVYTWQVNLPDQSVLDAKISAEEGIRTFTISLRGGLFLKGWLLHPLDATIIPDDPLQISVTGKEADIWVALAVGTGAPPRARLLGPGRGLNSEMEVAGLRLRYDPGSDRLAVADRERKQASIP